MKFPLCSRTVCVAGLLCLGICCPVHANALPQSNSDSVAVQAETPEDQPSQSNSAETVVIPGPLRSFLRMAGLSQEVSSSDVLPMLARNVALHGFEYGKETEYLVLLDRYVHQSREILLLTDTEGKIRVTGCEDAAHLIQVLGYKFERPCGQKNASLATANPERAFLTIDSGFPLTALEQALQKNETFTYSFPATRVPIFFKEKNWTGVTSWKRKSGTNLVDELLHDQSLDHLYWALAKCDRDTRLALVHSPGLKRLVPLATVFDLYGSGISIRSGKVVVPAGSQRDWEELVGANPNSPGEFVTHLLTKDHGWLAAYFDVVMRLNQAQQAHLVEGSRLAGLYGAYRSAGANANAAYGVFPKNAGLLILFTSLKWEANGDLAIPGGIEVWKEIFSQGTKRNDLRDLARRSGCCGSPEQLLEVLVSSSNFETGATPMRIFLMLSAMDARRSQSRHLSDETEELVASRFSEFERWFPIFSDFPALDDTSINRFVSAADGINGISSPTLRANALGAFQANIGLWRILAQQGQIPDERLNTSWQGAVQPFIGISSSVQLFGAARSSLQSLFLAAAGSANLSQDQIVDLLAGPSQDSPDGQRVHRELAARIRAVLDDQRLVSLDTLFGLYDGLSEMAHGADVGNTMLLLAGDLREFEMPRPIFTGSEKTSWSPLIYSSRHAELQIRTDLTKVIRSHGSPSQLEAARGQLTPFLRDTLVGLNYAYYEPPGAEVLHNNPLFVRSHDFSAVSIQGVERIWGAPNLIGVGATAGGGAYLMGSLADLPYALATTEEEFIAPKNVQALIWREAVPDLLVSAVVPRWWAVTRNELHSVALYQRLGEELLTSSASNPDLKAKVIEILSDRMTPDWMERTEEALQSTESATAMVSQTPPADTFYLAVEFRKRYSDQASMWGPAGRELEDLSRKSPSDVSPDRISRDFGVPHSAFVLGNSCALLNMKPVPAFGGDASRLLAESWQSNNLYWARLADEMGDTPVMLNVLVPTLTRHMVANIFASNIDDWPALLRAMEETGDEFRNGKIAIQGTTTVARQ